jgi:hypothetical protein
MTARRTGWIITLSCAAACLGSGAACKGKAASPRTAAERTAFLAQPCPGLELGAARLDPANARVFVEVADVSTRDLPQPIGRWLDANAVKVRSTANLIAFPNVPTSMPWGQCVDAVCSSMKLSITLTAQLPERGSEPIVLALRIDEAAPEGPDAARQVLLDTTLRALNQEPVVLPPAPKISDGSVVVTAYVLSRHDDLHRILECRAR